MTIMVCESYLAKELFITQVCEQHAREQHFYRLKDDLFSWLPMAYQAAHQASDDDLSPYLPNHSREKARCMFSETLLAIGCGAFPPHAPAVVSLPQYSTQTMREAASELSRYSKHYCEIFWQIMRIAWLCQLTNYETPLYPEMPTEEMLLAANNIRPDSSDEFRSPYKLDDSTDEDHLEIWTTMRLTWFEQQMMEK